MATVHWTGPALKALAEVYLFIAKDSVVYAERMHDRILEAPRILETFPFRGWVVPEYCVAGGQMTRVFDNG